MVTETAARAPFPRQLLVLVVALFFIWGGATSLNDVLIPKLKGLYQLSYAEVMLTQFAFFTAYFIVSIPAGALIARIGYLRGIVLGLSVTAAGALLFWPAAGSGVYWSYLVALFVLAAGITVLQVAANPLISELGDERNASSRLTLAQAFNSLGTTLWPWIGSTLILAGAASTDPKTLSPSELGAFRISESAVVAHTYVGIGIVLALLAAVFWFMRNAIAVARPPVVSFADSLSLLKRRRVLLGCVALFVYVGAEVSIGSMMVSYLEQPSVMGLNPQSAGHRLALYWGGAMVGRFIGAYLLRVIEPGRLLTIFATVAALLVLTAIFTTGPISGWALLSVGLFNSIMFPTVFSLALQGLGDRTPEGSGLLCMAIVGGAILPLCTGALADASTLATALIIPVVCYAVIGVFGIVEPTKG